MWLSPAAVGADVNRGGKRNAATDTAQRGVRFPVGAPIGNEIPENGKATFRLRAGPLFWHWSGDQTVSAEAESDGEANEGCRREPHKVSHSDHHGEGGHCEKETKLLQSGAANQIIEQDQPDEERHRNPSESGDYQQCALEVSDHAM